MRPERAARLVVGLLLLLLVIAPLFANGVDLLVDWLWFGQEGFRSVYLTILKSQITLSSLAGIGISERSEEHTSELQSQSNLVCRLLLEKKKELIINTPLEASLQLVTSLKCAAEY